MRFSSYSMFMITVNRKKYKMVSVVVYLNFDKFRQTVQHN